MKRRLTGNLTLMREMNKALVLEMIRRYAPISRVEIVEKTELTAATVSRIVSELIESGYVVESGYGNSQGG